MLAPMRVIEMPAARITVSSLLRASMPMPTSVPMSAPMGRNWKNCSGMLKTTKRSACSPP